MKRFAWWTVIGAVALIVGYVWGVATVTYRVFPYTIIKSSSGISPAQRPLQIAITKFHAAHPRKADIVFIGDSIFGMIPWNDVFPERSVAIRAIGGSTSGQTLARIDSVIATQAPIAVMLIGTNDAAQGIDRDETIRNVTAIRKRLSGRLILISVPRCTDLDPLCSAMLPRIAELHKAYPTLPGVEYVKLPAMRDSDFSDGIHPSASGMEKIVETVKSAL
ncbi:hypothetical protein HY78_08725 [Rhizorhabdus wittichii DC-6]|nr:hypothetical protein HY78_08725 [Rhizorhabdus wittichii DC-6]